MKNKFKVCMILMLILLFRIYMTANAAEYEIVTGPGSAARVISSSKNNNLNLVNLDISFVTSSTNITIKGRYKGSSTPRDLYLFEFKAYEDNIGERTDYLQKFDSSDKLDINIDISDGSGRQKIFSKYALAIKEGDVFKRASNFIYVNNPEMLSHSHLPFNLPSSKKGLVIEHNMLKDAFDLGIKSALINIDFVALQGSGINYKYEGRNYTFNKGIVEHYDEVIRELSKKNIQITAVLLNSWNESYKELIFPDVVKQEGTNYYAMNSSTKEGERTLRAITSFLANRYSGEKAKYGRISNWVLGNEINAQKIWNYIGDMDLYSYIYEYARSFRLMYTAIKLETANSRIYYSLDYNWNKENSSNLWFKGKEVFDTFASIINSEGNINWNLAYHPYPHPLNSANFWDEKNTNHIKNDSSSIIVNFSNIDVVTNYLSNFKNKDGQDRRVILSEQGFTSVSPEGENEELQAAAFVYSYHIVEANPYIDTYLLSRQVDHPEETKDFIYIGLWTTDENDKQKPKAVRKKRIWEIFKNIDNPIMSLNISEFAKPVIGISKWSDLINNFKYKNME